MIMHQVYKDGLLQRHTSNNKSWAWTKSFPNIKIMNKIVLSYHYNIFRQSFGYGIFKGEIWLLYDPEFLPSFRRHERGIRSYSTSCNWSGNWCSIRSVSVNSFPKFLDIYSNSFICNCMVLLPRNNGILIETLWYAIYGIYISNYLMENITN
eukprot:95995_1